MTSPVSRRTFLPKAIGVALYLALSIAGAAILAAYFIVPARIAPDPSLHLGAMQVGALLTLPPLVVFFWAPRALSRLDPEPWWKLGLSFSWGALAASGLSALGNTLFEEGVTAITRESSFGPALGYALSASIGAPMIEELWKGIPVLFAFWLFRRGMDGIADSVLYAAFSALGFATTENVIYYARAALDEVTLREQGALAAVVMMRGILSPWGHPLYTSMIGLGFGIARETRHRWTRRLAPIIGYLAAVSLHAGWNGAALISDDFTRVLLPLSVALIALFGGMITALVARQGRIIRQNLQAEVSKGALTEEEVNLIASPFARLRATLFHGGIVGQRFVATAARLGFHEWHRRRARHVEAPSDPFDSSDRLRQELAELRMKMQRRMPRPSALVR